MFPVIAIARACKWGKVAYTYFARVLNLRPIVSSRQIQIGTIDLVAIHSVDNKQEQFRSQWLYFPLIDH